MAVRDLTAWLLLLAASLVLVPSRTLWLPWCRRRWLRMSVGRTQAAQSAVAARVDEVRELVDVAQALDELDRRCWSGVGGLTRRCSRS